MARTYKYREIAAIWDCFAAAEHLAGPLPVETAASLRKSTVGEVLKAAKAAIGDSDLWQPCPSASQSNAVLPVIADGNTWPRLKKASASMLPDEKPSSAKPTSAKSACSFGELTSAMSV
jgi:hypothetical protein